LTFNLERRVYNVIKNRKQDYQWQRPFRFIWGLDISTVEALRLSLEYFNGLDQLYIDFEGIRFVDSTGMAGIIDSVQTLRKMKISVFIKNIPIFIYEILAILGIPEICGSEVFEFPKGLTN